MPNSQLESRSFSAHVDFGDERFVFGQSSAMRALQAKLTTVAISRVPVLIYGQSGTGKELLARTIHRLSSMSDGAFLKVNCAAVPATLFDSELSECEKDAFAGAKGKPPGQVESSNKGTLFLDEITEIDSASQVKVLELLQGGRVCFVGGRGDTEAEIRIICSTKGDPEREVANGSFREDLYYRINVISLRLPTLRERRDDIPALVEHFIESFNTKFSCQARPLSQRLIAALQSFDWPGNIRQLENMIKRYVILGSEEVIIGELNSKMQLNQLFADIPEFSVGKSISLKHVTKDMVRNFERQIITKVLEAHRWNRTEAARALNISYRSLLQKVKSSQLVNPRTQSSTEQ